MAKITYNNKTALITNPDIADENKVTDNDMNEIKQVVNENAINISNEVDEDYRVNLLKGKNMIDSSSLVAGDFTGQIPTTRVSTRQQLYLKAGTYTFSTNLNASTYRYYINTLKGTPPNSGQKYNSGWQTGSSFTFTITNANEGYFVLVIGRVDNGTLSVSDVSSNQFMLNEGSTALSYEEFIPNQIVVDDIKYSDTLNVGTSVDSRSRVNIIRQVNNILPKGTIYTLTSGSIALNFEVPKANTKYTMKTNLPSTSGSALVFFGSGADAQLDSVTNGVWEGSPKTMTSDANKYVTIAFRYLSGFSNIKLSDYWFTLAEGTSGVDYITPSIYVDNEEIYSKPVVLWTNPSPSNTFAGQQITLNDNIENYSYYEVVYKSQRVSSACKSTKSPTNLYARLETIDYFMIWRDITNLSGKNMTFDEAKYYQNYGSPSNQLTTPYYLIPYQVIGYK